MVFPGIHEFGLGIRRLLLAMESPNHEWIKTLAIALISSFFTVCLIEPVRAAIQKRVRTREWRRILYCEMVLNFRALDSQVSFAERDREMKSGIGERFAMSFKKSGFDLARQDPISYYGIDDSERYWIELLYRGMEHIIKGQFDNDEQRFRSAHFTAGSLLTYVKNRNLSKRLVLKVSPIYLRREILTRLPAERYVDVEPPSIFERIRRKFD